MGGFSYRVSEPFTDGSGKLFTQYGNYRAALQESDAFRVGHGMGRLLSQPGEQPPCPGGLHPPAGGPRALSLPPDGRDLRRHRPDQLRVSDRQSPERHPVREVAGLLHVR